MTSIKHYLRFFHRHYVARVSGRNGNRDEKRKRKLVVVMSLCTKILFFISPIMETSHVSEGATDKLKRKIIIKIAFFGSEKPICRKARNKCLWFDSATRLVVAEHSCVEGGQT